MVPSHKQWAIDPIYIEQHNQPGLPREVVPTMTYQLHQWMSAN
jgi:hypothetical protein